MQHSPRGGGEEPGHRDQTTGRIFDIKRFAIHDGPGIRTTVFLKGCPLRCAWCHNPESVSRQRQVFYSAARCLGCRACEEACAEGAHRFEDGEHVYNRDVCVLCGRCVEACPAEALEIVGRDVTVAEVMDEVERDRLYYETSDGGMTVSGGEPLMQPDFTAALLQEAKARELHTCLDTSGHAAWEVLSRMVPFVDRFLYDVKLVDEALHRRFTGVSNARILENLRRLVGLGADVLLRCPIIPTVNDSDAHFCALAGLIGDLDGSVRCDIMPYHRLGVSKCDRLGCEYTLEQIESPADEVVQTWLEKLRALGVDATTG